MRNMDKITRIAKYAQLQVAIVKGKNTNGVVEVLFIKLSGDSCEAVEFVNGSCKTQSVLKAAVSREEKMLFVIVDKSTSPSSRPIRPFKIRMGRMYGI
jgi:hypothetical protein